AFSPDGNRIVSGSGDNTVRVWNASSGIQIISGSDCKNIEISGDGNSIPTMLHVNATQIYGTHPICFSSVSSHASSDTGQLLDDHIYEDISQPVLLHHDGWIRGPQGRLLLWIPTSLQTPFYSMHTKLIIPSGCCVELDLSEMVHGNKWQECFNYIS
ncbi:hypothetical protein M404DRAFT_1002965, partial [Pisolithus tinctorius Marx 270]